MTIQEGDDVRLKRGKRGTNLLNDQFINLWLEGMKKENIDSNVLALNHGLRMVPFLKAN